MQDEAGFDASALTASPLVGIVPDGELWSLAVELDNIAVLVDHLVAAAEMTLPVAVLPPVALAVRAVAARLHEVAGE